MTQLAPGVDADAIKKLTDAGAGGNGQMTEVLKILAALQADSAASKAELTKIKADSYARDKALEEHKKAAKILTTASSSNDEVKAATKFMLMDQGLTEAQATEQMQTMFDDEAAPATKPGTKAAPVEPTVIDALGKRIQGVHADVAAERGKRLTAYFNTAVKNSLTLNESVKALLGAASKIGGGKAELAKKAEEATMNRISEDAYTRLQVKSVQKGGVPLDEADIDAEVQAAIERNVGFVKQALGSFEEIGRTPETVGGSNEFDVDAINKAANTPPEFKPGEDPADLRTRLNDWTSAQLKADALASQSTGESKA